MEPYLFQGVVLPERAQLSLEFNVTFTHSTSAISGSASVSIILNQVTVWIETEHEWDIFDLRNVVVNIVRGHLNMIGFLKGLAYDLELTRVINRSLGVNYVYGIDIPCISERSTEIDLSSEIDKLRQKSLGLNGVYVQRCFGDLSSAMRNADDTGFYCYRAIESLRLHCAETHNIPHENKKGQWQKFRELSNCEEVNIRKVKEAADPLRHGGVSGTTSGQRSELLTQTWDIVERYLKSI